MSQNYEENTSSRVSFFHKFIGWRNSINTKSLLHLQLFISSFIQNLSFLHHLRSVFLIIKEKYGKCLHSPNIICNVGSCGGGLGRKTRQQSRQASLLKIVKVDGFSSSSILSSMLKFFEILQISLFLCYIIALKSHT